MARPAENKTIMAWFMAIFLTLSFIAMAVTVITRHSKLEIAPFGLKEILNGTLASNLGDELEDKLVIRGSAIAPWGAISYGIFKTGGKKVVVGREGWLFTAEEFEKYEGAAQAEARKISLVRKVNDYLGKRGIRLAVLIVPAKARIYPEYLGWHAFPASKQDIYGRFYGEVSAMGIPAPDLAAHYLREKENRFPLLCGKGASRTPA